jgi:anti-sigma regulatory factor (Ser/Thr protein kinase)
MELLVSELASNALHATWAMAQGAYIRFWLLSDKTSVIVSVWDCNPHPPVQVKADEDAESGRGLTIVDAMCDRWDWYAHKGFGGKVVWCELFLDSRRHTPGSQASHDLQ